MNPAKLILDDGTEFHGFSFGSPRNTTGELIFNTTMVGYCELLTDPTFAGQVLTLTWPLVGNSGVPPQTEDRSVRRFFESNRIWPCGLVVSEYSPQFSHWNAVRSLGDWLKEEGVPAITGIDTRALAKRIREKGTVVGQIVVDVPGSAGILPASSQAGSLRPQVNLTAEVSCKEIIEYEPSPHSPLPTPHSSPSILLLDLGVKNSVIRNLTGRGAKVVRVPWNHDFTKMEYDGLVLSNGPGDPAFLGETVENVKKAIHLGRPIFGIGMGNLVLGKAAGAETFRLPFGHRTSNQPVRLCGTDRTHVTPQNHGFALDPSRLPDDWEQWFVNLNDGTCEGIRHKTKPFFAVQFHPENCGGPRNRENVYDLFFSQLKPHQSEPRT